MWCSCVLLLGVNVMGAAARERQWWRSSSMHFLCALTQHDLPGGASLYRSYLSSNCFIPRLRHPTAFPTALSGCITRLHRPRCASSSCTRDLRTPHTPQQSARADTCPLPAGRGHCRRAVIEAYADSLVRGVVFGSALRDVARRAETVRSDDANSTAAQMLGRVVGCTQQQAATRIQQQGQQLGLPCPFLRHSLFH